MELKKREYYFSKSEYWSSGPHWMTSASRDLWDHFFNSIASTFEHNIVKNPKSLEIINKILYLRKWYSKETNKIFKPDYNCDFPFEYSKDNYVEGFVDLEFYESEEKDPNVYKDFHDFYRNANHGWCISGKSYEIVKEFWDHLIKDCSPETLNDVYKEEIDYFHNLLNEWASDVNEWKQSGSTLSFSKYIFSQKKNS